jgi:AAA ATPase domain
MSNTIPPSPYQPGSAAQPPVLAGREHLIRTAEVAVGGQGNRRDSFQVLYGPRGVGKTVLMDRYGTIARDGGWAVARHEARAPYDPIVPIIDELHRCERLTKRVQRELHGAHPAEAAPLRDRGATVRQSSGAG